MSALVSFERVFEVLDLKPLIAEKPDARRGAGRPGVGRVRRRRASPTRRPTRCRSPRWRRSPTLDTRGGVEVLHDVSFRAEPGQMVALVGSSGAGKSTIAQLLPAALRRRRRRGAARRRRRPRPDRRLDPRDARHGHPGRAPVPRVGPRQPAAGPARRRPRTSCGRRCAGPGSADLVASLPDGLDTVVGERGYRLSGGERQRLTIARLLLARPRVVILDEATAHLDSTSEAAVQAALARGARRPDRGGDRAPAVHRPRGRPDPGDRGRPDRRARHPRRAARGRAAATRSCTAPSSTSRTSNRRSWGWPTRSARPEVRAGSGGRFSYGIDSTMVVRVETLAAARMRASRSSSAERARHLHVQDVALVAGDRVARRDLRQAGQPLGRVVGLARVDRSDRDERGQPETDRVGVDAGGVAADHAALLEPAHPLLGGRGRQSGPAAELGERQPAVLGEQPDDRGVQRLQRHRVSPPARRARAGWCSAARRRRRCTTTMSSIRAPCRPAR